MFLGHIPNSLRLRAKIHCSALVPLSGGIIRHAEYFVDPALLFTNGWNQVYSNIITIPAETVATVVLIQCWVQINNAV